MAEIMFGHTELLKLSVQCLCLQECERNTFHSYERWGEKVIFTIKESKYFAFQLDETTTVSNDSQLLATVYVRHRNRRQEVFNGGLDIPKFDENSTIYSVSHFNLRAWSFV